MSETQPCRYPGCKDRDGQPRPTTTGMCSWTTRAGEHRGCITRFASDWKNLIFDWVDIRTHMYLPTPKQADRVRSTRREYGHLAERPSDAARAITNMANDIHDNLAEVLHADPPPHPGTSEAVRIRAAHEYVTPRIPLLAQQEWAQDTAQSIRDLRHQLGNLRTPSRKPIDHLPYACPHCEHYALIPMPTRERDYIACGHCRQFIRAEYLIDTILNTLDSNVTTPASPGTFTQEK